MKRKIAIIIMLIVLGTLIINLYGSFATSNTISTNESIYNITLVDSTEEITIPANSNKTVVYQTTNTNKGKVNYAIAYAGTNISVQVYCDSMDYISGSLDYGETKFINLNISNTGDSESVATITTVLGYEYGGSLDTLLPEGYTFVTEYYGHGNLSNCIANMYDNAEKTTITHNSIQYNFAKPVLLMNDRLGGTTSDYNAGNIRYYEKTPNNYIDIGDTYKEDIYDESIYTELNYTSFEECINALSKEECGLLYEKGDRVLYRIIGLFKNIELEDGSTNNLVKIVREESIGTYPFDDSSTDWATSSLQSVLNEGEYYESLSDTVLNRIEEVKWYHGKDGHAFANVVYNNERKYESWIEKIAIIYPSDYGYATDISKCNYKLDSYSNCTSTNWLFNGVNSWLLAYYTGNNEFYLNSSGVVYPYGWVGAAYNIYPTFYLKSNSTILKGTGTKEDPYVLL